MIRMEYGIADPNESEGEDMKLMVVGEETHLDTPKNCV